MVHPLELYTGAYNVIIILLAATSRPGISASWARSMLTQPRVFLGVNKEEEGNRRIEEEEGED